MAKTISDMKDDAMKMTGRERFKAVMAGAAPIVDHRAGRPENLGSRGGRATYKTATAAARAAEQARDEARAALARAQVLASAMGDAVDRTNAWCRGAFWSSLAGAGLVAFLVAAGVVMVFV